MAVLLDTSAIIALANPMDRDHRAVRAAIETIVEPLIVPLPVLAEVDYLVMTRSGAQAACTIMDSFVAGEVLVDHLVPADLQRAAQLMRTYADAPLGFVDSSIIALAERLKAARIVTLDRRHFSFVRPSHRPNFELLP